MPPVLAIVVPCFNEEQVLPETTRRLGLLLDGLRADGHIAGSSHVCFVDDGSTDRTWAIARDLHAQDDRFQGIKLSRNRGHQNALLAGLLAVSGDVVISMDADLQDDLGAVPAMLRAARDGADIVYGARRSRSVDTPLKRHTAQMYYRLLHWLGVEIVYNHADYRLMTRRAIEALRDYEETNLFLRALIPRLGFRTAVVPYDRAERFAGESKYPIRKMLALALEGVTSFSTRPLRMVTVLGCISALVTFGLTLWAAGAWLTGATVPGWSSTVIPIYLVCSVQLLSLGVVGEYIGKLYLETKRRPRYHIAEVLEPTTTGSQAPSSEEIAGRAWVGTSAITERL